MEITSRVEGLGPGQGIDRVCIPLFRRDAGLLGSILEVRVGLAASDDAGSNRTRQEAEQATAIDELDVTRRAVKHQWVLLALLRAT